MIRRTPRAENKQNETVSTSNSEDNHWSHLTCSVPVNLLMCLHERVPKQSPSIRIPDSYKCSTQAGKKINSYYKQSITKQQQLGIIVCTFYSPDLKMSKHLSLQFSAMHVPLLLFQIMMALKTAHRGSLVSISQRDMKI